MTRAWILAPFCGALALLAACTAGQTGGEVGEGDPNGTGGAQGTGGGEGTGGGPVLGGYGCVVTDTVLLSVGDVSALGYSAEDILEFAGGVHSVPIEWKDGSGETTTLNTTPAAGATEVELTISYEGGDVSLLYRENGAEGGPLLGTGPCTDQLTIDVAVQVKTENGAFDDTFPATLVVYTASLASLHVEFEPEELSGTFRSEVLAPADAVGKQFTIDAAFAPGGFSGAISVMITGGNEQLTYVTGGEFARWPQGYCADIRGIPVDVADAGLGQAAWEALTYPESLAFIWEEGSESTLSLDLTAADGAGCYQYEVFSGQEYVTFEVQAHAQTGDDRIDGTWSLGATVQLTSSQPSHATLYQRGYAATSAASFDEATGISGADLTGYETYGFSIQLDSDLTTNPAMYRGAFAVLGISPFECPSDPVPEGGTAPGCAGTEAAELESATIGD